MTVAEMEQMETFTPSGLIMCDGCHVSRAYVRFSRSPEDIFHFCSHHSNAHELVLTSMGYLMTDRRDVLEAAEQAYKTVKADDDKF